MVYVAYKPILQESMGPPKLRNWWWNRKKSHNFVDEERDPERDKEVINGWINSSNHLLDSGLHNYLIEITPPKISHRTLFKLKRNERN